MIEGILKKQLKVFEGFEVLPISLTPTGERNYGYLVKDKQTLTSFLVDPAFPKFEARPDEFKSTQLDAYNVKAILCTHKHLDHSCGNKPFSQILKDPLKIYGGKAKEDYGVTEFVNDKDQIQFGGLTITAYATPCHTRESICYLVQATKEIKTQKGALFTGDTLFNGGCGRFFEGTSGEMNRNLNEILANIPNDPFIFPGHEYTAGNVAFTKKLLQKIDSEVPKEHEEEKNKLMTILTDKFKGEYFCGEKSISDEKSYNPFMMLDHPCIKLFCKSGETADERMDILRTAKNNGLD